MLLNRDFSPIEKNGLYPLGEIHVACFSLASPENNGNDPIYLFIPDIENSFRITEQCRYVPATRNIRQARLTFWLA